jgi:hypothetical protein
LFYDIIKGEKLGAFSPREEKRVAPSPLAEGWEGGVDFKNE